MKFFIFISLLILGASLEVCSGTSKESYQHEVAVAAIFHNEGPYLKEWIEFHKLAGVTRIYLYNNCSDDNFRDVLEPYLGKEVELFEWNYKYPPGNEEKWLAIQTGAFQDAITRSCGVAKWLALIDIDEFLMPVSAELLGEVLKEFESYGAVCVNWQTYGTSNIEKLDPTKLLTEQLVRKSHTTHKDNLRVKSIVRPDRVLSPAKNAHHVVLKGDYLRVMTDHQTFDSFFAPKVLVDKLRINHYWTRCCSYFKEQKIMRRRLWGFKLRTLMKRARDLNMVVDTCMEKYWERLNAACFMK